MAFGKNNTDSQICPLKKTKKQKQLNVIFVFISNKLVMTSVWSVSPFSALNLFKVPFWTFAVLKKHSLLCKELVYCPVYDTDALQRHSDILSHLQMFKHSNIFTSHLCCLNGGVISDMLLIILHFFVSCPTRFLYCKLV